MDAVLKELRGLYDVIVVDSPPFLTVADSLVLARKTDALILVIRAESSTYDAIRRGIKALGDIGVRPLGLVLNGYDDKRGGAYYYHQYYYQTDGDEGKKGRKRRRTSRDGA
jgi:Mrp family chromosome partitioning ATPase